MKIFQMIGSGLVAMVLMTGIAMADAGPQMGMGKGMGMMDNDGEGYRMMYREHHQVTQDMMMMLKDVMGILKGMNHHPTAEEKERLGKMMDKLDKMMAEHEDMMKKAREYHEKRMERWKEHHGMMDDDENDDKSK